MGHFFGLDDPSGPLYLFWSGIGSDIAEFAILGGIIQLYRRHNCPVKGCWRIQRHPVAGTEHVVCRKHHPDDELTHQQVLDDHAMAKHA